MMAFTSGFILLTQVFSTLFVWRQIFRDAHFSWFSHHKEESLAALLMGAFTLITLIGTALFLIRKEYGLETSLWILGSAIPFVLACLPIVFYFQAKNSSTDNGNTSFVGRIFDWTFLGLSVLFEMWLLSFASSLLTH